MTTRCLCLSRKYQSFARNPFVSVVAVVVVGSSRGNNNGGFRHTHKSVLFLGTMVLCLGSLLLCLKCGDGGGHFHDDSVRNKSDNLLNTWFWFVWENDFGSTGSSFVKHMFCFGLEDDFGSTLSSFVVTEFSG